MLTRSRAQPRDVAALKKKKKYLNFSVCFLLLLQNVLLVGLQIKYLLALSQFKTYF